MSISHLAFIEFLPREQIEERDRAEEVMALIKDSPWKEQVANLYLKGFMPDQISRLVREKSLGSIKSFLYSDTAPQVTKKKISRLMRKGYTDLRILQIMEKVSWKTIGNCRKELTQSSVRTRSSNSSARPKR